jgi:hypothetical protein
MLHIRRLERTDSLEQLTALLHRGYARLGAVGLNDTAVDQTGEVTADRIQGGHCLVALWNGELAGMVLGKPRLKDTRITRGEPRGHPLAPLDPQNNRLRRGS